MVAETEQPTAEEKEDKKARSRQRQKHPRRRVPSPSATENSSQAVQTVGRGTGCRPSFAWRTGGV